MPFNSITLLVPITLVATAGANIITVGPGLDAETLNDALAMAADGDELAIASGTWLASAAGEAVVHLEDRVLTLRALDASDPPVLDGGDSGRACIVDGGTVTLEDLELRGGTVTGGDIDGDGVTADWERSGGAITANGATLNVRRVNITAGHALHGGALAAWASTVALDDVDISNTSATFFGGGLRTHGGMLHFTGGSVDGCAADTGGAMVAGGGAKITIANLAVSNCAATWYGGGLCFDSSQSAVETQLTNVSLDACQAGQSGGGVYAYGGTLDGSSLSMRNCSAVNGGGFDGVDASVAINGGLVELNTASNQGGGFRIVDGPARLQNMLIRSNQAVYGGGVMLDWCDLGLFNGVTLDDNSAQLRGGGLYTEGAFDVTVENCTVSSNTTGLGAAGLEFTASCLGYVSSSVFCGQSVHMAGSWQDDGGNTFDDACAGGSCIGDVDGSGQIDLIDLMDLIEAWGSGPGTADCDDDGQVGVLDLILLLKRWGASC
ncbi:MAG: hypothetical protein MK101_11680 [Phycisphaerales bacterium]|nr:hypothetical protein [Phycisphaerales bacterium]